MYRRSRLIALAFAVLSLGAARIHFHAADAHSDEAPLFAAFFFLLGCLQGAWGLAVVGGMTPRLRLYGVLLNNAVVAIWFASRTTGLPVGPHPWSPETIGALDATATLLEVAIVVGLIWLGRVRRSRRGTAVSTLAFVLPRRPSPELHEFSAAGPPRKAR